MAKALAAQAAGYEALIVLDPSLPSLFADNSVYPFTMSDDSEGAGLRVDIPSALIMGEDARRFAVDSTESGIESDLLHSMQDQEQGGHHFYFKARDDIVVSLSTFPPSEAGSCRDKVSLTPSVHRVISRAFELSVNRQNLDDKDLFEAAFPSPFC